MNFNLCRGFRIILNLNEKLRRTGKVPLSVDIESASGWIMMMIDDD